MLLPQKTAVFATLVAMTGTVAADPLTTEISELLDMNPRILAAHKELDAASDEVKVARADYLPTVSLRGDAGPEYIDTPSSRRLRGAAGRSDLLRRTVGVAVTQRLFAGGRNRANLAAARVAERLARLNLRFTTQDVLYTASQA